MTANYAVQEVDEFAPVLVYLIESGSWKIKGTRLYDGSILLSHTHTYNGETHEATVQHADIATCIWSGQGWFNPRFRWSALVKIGEQCIPPIYPMIGQMVVITSDRFCGLTKKGSKFCLELRDKTKPVYIHSESLEEIWHKGKELLFPFNDRKHLRT